MRYRVCILLLEVKEKMAYGNSGGATVRRTRTEPDQKRFAPDKKFFLRIEKEMIIL